MNQRSTLTSIAYEKIRSDIIAGKIGPQAPLIEAEISQRLEMSKTPVREALMRLAREGLVEINDYRGARVSSFSEKDFIEIFQLRCTLEPMAIRLAYDTMGAAETRAVAKLLAEASSAQENGDWAELVLLNREFHAKLWATCPNERVVALVEQLSDVVRLITLRGWAHHPTHSLEFQEHQEIFQALFVKRDLELGCDLLVKHIGNFITAHSASRAGR